VDVVGTKCNAKIYDKESNHCRTTCTEKEAIDNKCRSFTPEDCTKSDNVSCIKCLHGFKKRKGSNLCENPGCPENQYEASEGNCTACPADKPYSHAHAQAEPYVDSATALAKCRAEKLKKCEDFQLAKRYDEEKCWDSDGIVCPRMDFDDETSLCPKKCRTLKDKERHGNKKCRDRYDNICLYKNTSSVASKLLSQLGYGEEDDDGICPAEPRSKKAKKIQVL
jgi:hypothetical protein